MKHKHRILFFIIALVLPLMAMIAAIFLLLPRFLEKKTVQVDSDIHPILGDIHYHADFKVYLEGRLYDFAQSRYMSEKNVIQSNFVHLHDMDGDVIHKHMSGITLKTFFTSLGMQFDGQCFRTDNAVAYCNSANKILKMYVNGERNYDFQNYDFQDMDRILITYGSEDEAAVQRQIKSVTDKACIQSLKCPERGKPSDESTCVSGTNCVVNP